ncbi:hypothetical protein [Streptomyces aurantiogriseus]|uniref:hypothetical protein n=1 Tax=Streptomyces aurantiogriseus TaxID=66870 RepID=UPI001E60DEB2|nr:hypothetical protein [Streptomyces aurantiogriseus]
MTATASCLAGESVVGGGFAASTGNIRDNFPSGGPPPTGWTVTTTSAQTITAFVLCATTTP